MASITPINQLSMRPKRQRLTENLTESLGHRLARLRKERGLTQQDLAAHLKISQTNVSDYEHDKLRLHGDVIVALAKLLKVSADELLGLERSPRQPVVGDRQLLQHLTLIERLPRKDREALMRTIRLYVGRVRQ